MRPLGVNTVISAPSRQDTKTHIRMHFTIMGSVLQGLVVNVITREERGVRIVEAQVEPRVVMRLALVKTEPELGVEALRLLPDILKDERVRRELGLPDFDEIVLRPRTHSPEEADVELRRAGTTIAEYSVKFAVRGNFQYAITAWKREIRPLDLILLIPLRGVKGEKSIYYIGVFWISAELRLQPTSEIVRIIHSLLSEKMREENLDNIWSIDIREIATALRDYENIRRLAELAEKIEEVREEMRKGFQELSTTLKKIAELLERLLRKEQR